VSHDDVLFGYRLRLFTLAQEIGVRPACWAMAFTTRPTTAGSERSTAGASRPCGSASAAPPDAQPNRTPPRAAGDGLRPRLSGLWAAADLGRASPPQVGWDPDLRARRLAGASPLQPQHPRRSGAGISGGRSGRESEHEAPRSKGNEETENQRQCANGKMRRQQQSAIRAARAQAPASRARRRGEPSQAPK
jgi:hypothetical protein